MLKWRGVDNGVLNKFRMIQVNIYENVLNVLKFNKKQM